MRAPAVVQTSGVITREDFSLDRRRGRVLGSVGSYGLERQGADVERVLEIRDGALRIHPLATPGWRRACLTYGPLTRRNGLSFTVHVLNGDNGSAPYRLASLPRRAARWLLGSGTDSLVQRMLRFPFRLKREGTWHRLRRWARATRWSEPMRELGGNLAVGWFTEALPDDPTRCGNCWVVRGAGPENGHLLCRASGTTNLVIDRLANVPIQYTVVLRETGAAYYLSSALDIAGTGTFPFMRPVAIDATEQGDLVHPGIHQSAVGETGFGVETVLYGTTVADVQCLRKWYATAHAADSLTGHRLLSEQEGSVGGPWNCIRGDFRRTVKGVVSCSATAFALLHPRQATGLVHTIVHTGTGRGEISIVWRARDEENHWRLRFDREACHLEAVVDGVVRKLSSDPTVALKPGNRTAVQITDDGSSISVSLDGEHLSSVSVRDPTHAEEFGVGISTHNGDPDLLVAAFEAHPRLVEIPPDLRLEPGWREIGTEIVVESHFTGQRDNLAGYQSCDGSVWHKLMGSDRMALNGNAVQVVASAAEPLRRRLAYGIDWSDPSFADITATIVPPKSSHGDIQQGRGGVIFWQDDQNYIIINTWLDDSHTGQFRGCSAISSFFYLRGFDDVYDAVWTNLADRIRKGEASKLRVVFDGLRYRAYVDGEAVLYRSLADIYPHFAGLQIRRVGIVANWEWGHDTGSRFLSFMAARRMKPVVTQHQSAQRERLPKAAMMEALNDHRLSSALQNHG